MSRYAIERDTLANIANSIRTKLNISDGIDPSDMAHLIDQILTPSGTLNIIENGLYNISEYESVNVAVPTAGFSNDVFVSGSYSGSYISDSLSSLKYGCFYDCKGLIYASFANATKIGGYAFYGCSGLTQLHIPKMTGSIDPYTFYYCSALTELRLPLTTDVKQYAFNTCKKLKIVELGNISNLGTNCFSNCSNLDTLIIRKTGTSITTLSAAKVFTNTPIANGTGYIYVPAALCDSFKTATNWSVYASQIRAIEDYPDICGG